MAEGYWKKGDFVPAKGTPHRHTTARAVVLLENASIDVMQDALRHLIAKRPEETLDALAKATEAGENREDAIRAARRAALHA
jgi:hypothetical protein